MNDGYPCECSDDNLGEVKASMFYECQNCKGYVEMVTDKRNRVIEECEGEMKRELVVTELGDNEKWLLNFGKYNHKTDVEISKEIAKEILRLKRDTFTIKSSGESFTIRDGMAKGRVWIEKEDGEGGDFDQDELFMFIREFYNKRF